MREKEARKNQPVPPQKSGVITRNQDISSTSYLSEAKVSSVPPKAKSYCEWVRWVKGGGN
jgi:hypothetical protein